MLNPSAGKFSEETREEGEGAKTGESHAIGGAFICRNMIG